MLRNQVTLGDIEPVDIHVAFWRVPSLFEHSERFARDILT
jgi:hypothetical protein